MNLIGSMLPLCWIVTPLDESKNKFIISIFGFGFWLLFCSETLFSSVYKDFSHCFAQNIFSFLIPTV